MSWASRLVAVTLLAARHFIGGQRVLSSLLMTDRKMPEAYRGSDATQVPSLRKDGRWEGGAGTECQPSADSATNPADFSGTVFARRMPEAISESLAEMAEIVKAVVEGDAGDTKAF